jgi:hypothetical protein
MRKSYHAFNGMIRKFIKYAGTDEPLVHIYKKGRVKINPALNAKQAKSDYSV